MIIRVSGVQVPPPLSKNFNEIDQIYQSHLIYGGFRIRFNMLICQSVCDQCVTGIAKGRLYRFNVLGYSDAS